MNKIFQKINELALTKKLKSIDYSRVKTKTHAVLMGNSWNYGLLFKIVLYALLVLFGFIFAYPIIYMLSYSFMSPADVINPFVVFIPSGFYFTNFSTAFKVLDYLRTLMNSLLISLLPSVLQCVAVAITGYGLARFRFPGRTVLLIMIVITFIIPSQLTLIPQVIMFTETGMANILSVIVTSLFGQGIRSSIFILIFFQFFRSIPKSLEEAAKIDGANVVLIFLKIACPLVFSGFILTFLFSFVWYFNETVLTALLIPGLNTLPLQLESFRKYFDELANRPSVGSGDTLEQRDLNEAIYLAGTLLSILPLLVIYFIFQRFFIEGIEKAGITGE